MTEILKNCDPSPEEIESLKRDTIEEQKVSLDNPLNQCSYLFRRFLYGGDNYGNFVLGRPQNLETFSASQAQAKRRAILEGGGFVVLGGEGSRVTVWRI